MSLFGDLDVASANENPFWKDDGTYRCQVSGAEIKTSNKNGSKGLALKYNISEGPKKGQFIQEWKPIPFVWEINGYETEQEMNDRVNYDDEIASRAQRNLSFLKARLKDFGLPPEKMNTLEAKDLLELPELDVTIKNENGRENVKGVQLAVAGSSGSKGDPFSG